MWHCPVGQGVANGWGGVTCPAVLGPLSCRAVARLDVARSRPHTARMVTKTHTDIDVVALEAEAEHLDEQGNPTRAAVLRLEAARARAREESAQRVQDAA